MVGKRILVWMTLLVLTAPAVRAQAYDVNDTVTEYPMKGTFYHDRFEGRKTASGEIFNQNLFTAAHWKIKLGTHVLVTNRNTGLKVIVKVNDRCPRRGVFDMSRRAARAIGIKGSQPVSIRILPEGYERLCLAQDSQFDSVPSSINEAARAQEPPLAMADKKQNKENVTPVVVAETKKPVLPPAKAPDFRYNLLLGTVQTHGEAYEMVRKLPQNYQDKVVIDTPDEDFITITLDVRLTLKKAQELNKTLKNTFNDSRITPTE